MLLFVEKGLTATSIRDIACRAGVAKGTFYHYFRDRAAMTAALHRRWSSDMAEAVQRAIDRCEADDWQAKLAAWTDAIIAGYVSNHTFHHRVFHSAETCQRGLLYEEPFMQSLAALIENGIEAGIWKTDEPVLTAVCMFSGLQGLVDEAVVNGADIAQTIPKLVRLFSKMLRRS